MATNGTASRGRTWVRCSSRRWVSGLGGAGPDRRGGPSVPRGGHGGYYDPELFRLQPGRLQARTPELSIGCVELAASLSSSPRTWRASLTSDALGQLATERHDNGLVAIYEIDP